MRILNSEKGRDLGLSEDVWREVVKAIEDALPLYDEVNELISFGQAQKARNYAIEKLGLSNGMRVLDSGIGPGNNSRLVFSTIDPSLLVGLDESVKQLKTVKENLGEKQSGPFDVVRGSFEFLPFRDGVFDAVVTSYALRDSLDLSRSVSEYSRVCGSGGRLAVVDIGKPDNFLKRIGSVLYVRFFMPLIAKFAIRGTIRGNPWRMIAPTYQSLPTNRTLLGFVKQWFPSAQITEFLKGGVIVIIGRKT